MPVPGRGHAVFRLMTIIGLKLPTKGWKRIGNGRIICSIISIAVRGAVVWLCDKKPAQGTFLQIVVHVDAKGKHDYSTVLDGDVLRLTACDEDKMLWLIYQFLASGEDPRIEASDLPPAMIDIAHAEGDFAFEYRGYILLPTQTPN